MEGTLLEVEIKKKILKLLKTDEEFRYAVAGLIGLDEVLKSLRDVGERLKELREDMNRGFELVNRRLDKHDDEMARLWKSLEELREDMNRGFELVNRRIDALGARWGVMSEESFREGLKGIVRDQLGYKVERWHQFDEEGLVYGYPSEVEVDVAVEDGKVLLLEVCSHAKTSDIYELLRKAQLYEKKTGKKPDSLIIITPYAEPKAVEAAERLGIKIYTKA